MREQCQAPGAQPCDCCLSSARLRRDRNSAENSLRILETRLAELESALAHATAHDGDHLSKASRAMVEMVIGQRDALRLVSEAAIAFVDADDALALTPTGSNAHRVASLVRSDAYHQLRMALKAVR